MTTHAERYQYLCDTLLQVGNYPRGLDHSYMAALYLMASDMELTEMFEKYITSTGLDFELLLEKESFSYDWGKTLVETAYNLFGWGDECRTTPHELALLPPVYKRFVCNALYIAAGEYEIIIDKNEHGIETITFDDKPLKEKEAILHQFDEFVETALRELE